MTGELGRLGVTSPVSMIKFLKLPTWFTQVQIRIPNSHVPQSFVNVECFLQQVDIIIRQACEHQGETSVNTASPTIYI